MHMDCLRYRYVVRQHLLLQDRKLVAREVNAHLDVKHETVAGVLYCHGRADLILAVEDRAYLRVYVLRLADTAISRVVQIRITGRSRRACGLDGCIGGECCGEERDDRGDDRDDGRRNVGCELDNDWTR